MTKELLSCARVAARFTSANLASGSPELRASGARRLREQESGQRFARFRAGFAGVGSRALHALTALATLFAIMRLALRCACARAAPNITLAPLSHRLSQGFRASQGL